MKRIVISQRRDAVPGRNEVRDALDVEWARIIWELGFLPVSLSSGIADVDAYLAELSPEAVLLSGGNDIGLAPERDRLEHGLLRHAERRGLPVLGVCRGLQMINHYLGGRLRPLPGHVGSRHRIQGPLAPEGREVNSYHAMGIRPDDLGRDLEPVAWDDEGAIEAARHKRLSWLGIMWHPEREKQLCHNDQSMILNILKG